MAVGDPKAQGLHRLAGGLHRLIIVGREVGLADLDRQIRQPLESAEGTGDPADAPAAVHAGDREFDPLLTHTMRYTRWGYRKATGCAKAALLEAAAGAEPRRNRRASGEGGRAPSAKGHPAPAGGLPRFTRCRAKLAVGGEFRFR